MLPGMNIRPGFLIPALALLIASRVQAQIIVTTAADENDTPAGAQVSLREALRDSANGGTVTFVPELAGKVLALISGEMAVSGKTVSVTAPPEGFVIEARGLSRHFNIAAGAGLHLTGLTLQGGVAPGDRTAGAQNGGSILNSGTLSLTDCVLRENRAAGGLPGTNGPSGPGFASPGGSGGPGRHGGAVSSSGSLTARRCQFVANTAGWGGWGGTGGNVVPPGPFSDGGSGGGGGTGGDGGAIASTGPLQLAECIFTSNSSGGGGSGGSVGFPGGNGPTGGSGGSSGSGGAIHQTGTLTAERCSFTANECPSGSGPGATFGLPQPWGGGYGGSGSGGALYWNGGTATLTNCTVTENRTGGGQDQPSGEHGGAIAAGGGSLLRLTHCTVAANRAVLPGETSGGNQYVGWSTGTAAGIVSSVPVEGNNCIFSGNMVDRTAGGFTRDEVNFSPNSPRSIVPFGALNGTPGTDAQLSLASLTTGPLPVLMPGATSPALNAGALLATPPATDQRGLPRTVGPPDLGAVEVQTTETPPRALQSISFWPPDTLQTSSLSLNATASSGLPVAYELVSGPATLSGSSLTITGAGFIAVRATQAGDAVTAPALPVVRVIAATHTIQFMPPPNYAIYPGSHTFVNLPSSTSAGLPVTWSFAGAWVPGFGLDGNELTATIPGSVQIRGENPGTAEYAPVNVTWTLNFVQGAVWWETPAAIGGGPHWFTLVEGSPHGLTMTARINVPHTSAVPVPAIEGVTVTPAAIPAGQTSMTCLITVPANPSLANRREEVPTGNPASVTASLFLVNRTTVPLDIFPPARVIAGVSMLVDVSCPGVPVPGLFGPPPHLGPRTMSVSAADYDNPAISVPVTLDAQANDSSLYPRKKLQVTFPPVNRRVRLTVTTDDGITGHAGPIQIFADTNADGDGVNDVVESALQRATDQFHAPPLVMQRDHDSLRAVLGSRPVNLQGWSIVIELSSDLEAWTPAPAGSITVTPNADGITETVTVLLPPSQETIYARLRASLP